MRDPERNLKALGVVLTERQRQAMRYLEKQGQRFLVDFGYANAEAKAREHRRTHPRARQPRDRKPRGRFINLEG